MQRIIWNVEDFLTREYRGAALWAWVVVLSWLAILAFVIVAVYFGFDPPPRCTSAGDCYPD